MSDDCEGPDDGQDDGFGVGALAGMRSGPLPIGIFGAGAAIAGTSVVLVLLHRVVRAMLCQTSRQFIVMSKSRRT